MNIFLFGSSFIGRNLFKAIFLKRIKSKRDKQNKILKIFFCQIATTTIYTDSSLMIGQSLSIKVLTKDKRQKTKKRTWHDNQRKREGQSVDLEKIYYFKTDFLDFFFNIANLQSTIFFYKLSSFKYFSILLMN